MTVSKADLARTLGLSRSTISSYLRRGMPEAANGRLDEHECRAWIRQNVRQQSGLRGIGGRMAAGEDEQAKADARSLVEAKRVRATFEALLAEHRATRLVESLAPVDAAIDAVADALATVKARLRQAPKWVAPRLVDVTTAPIAAATLSKTFCGALYDISREEGAPEWDQNLGDAPIDYAHARISHVSADGEIFHVPAIDDDEPELEAQGKKKPRRRSTQAIEEVIADTGTEAEVTQELLSKVERAVSVMPLTEAKTRRELAEGALRCVQYDLLKKRVVRINNVHDALTKNLNGVRSNIVGIASKVAPRCALLTDAKDIERLVSQELELVLGDLAAPKTLIESCLDE